MEYIGSQRIWRCSEDWCHTEIGCCWDDTAGERQAKLRSKTSYGRRMCRGEGGGRRSIDLNNWGGRASSQDERGGVLVDGGGSGGWRLLRDWGSSRYQSQTRYVRLMPHWWSQTYQSNNRWKWYFVMKWVMQRNNTHRQCSTAHNPMQKCCLQPNNWMICYFLDCRDVSTLIK